MAVFYRGPYAHITHEAYRKLRPDISSFPIGELESPYVVTQPVTGRPGIWFRTGAMLLVTMAAVTAATAWMELDSPEVVLLVLLATTFTSTAATGCWRLPGRHYELRATFRGRSVCLLQTTDITELGQVSRALTRAREYWSDTAGRYPPAGRVDPEC